MLFRDVITERTTADEWPKLRRRIHDAIAATMGRPPQDDEPHRLPDMSDSASDGLGGRDICIEVVPGFRTHGRIVLPPPDVEPNGVGVVCIHGTDVELAHRNVLSPQVRPNRAYAVELARRGCAAVALDQLGFGAGNDGSSTEQVLAAFAEQYPDWSPDGARLEIQKAGVSLLQSLDAFDARRIACIGNSLGGRAALMLAAFDERVDAAVVSTGVSPNVTNVYRNRPHPASLSPALDAAVAATGKPPYEYQELIAMVAPRTLLLVEPWNDPYNPFAEATLACFDKARRVWGMLGADAGCQILCHGHGHDTPPAIREYAYRVILGE